MLGLPEPAAAVLSPNARAAGTDLHDNASMTGDWCLGATFVRLGVLQRVINPIAERVVGKLAGLIDPDPRAALHKPRGAFVARPPAMGFARFRCALCGRGSGRHQDPCAGVDPDLDNIAAAKGWDLPGCFKSR